ncbi:MAG: hypothetical protein JSR99_17230 [Proteobacteria bacterium]|nr:hypothetical protein [Pseudomonadota bacterium]
MTASLHILLNGASAALIIFTASAAVASFFTQSSTARVIASVVLVLATLLIPISTRSVFEWTVSAVGRLSLPGLVLLLALAVSATTGQRIGRSAEFRFAALMLAVAGLVLYPAATGFLNYDTYMLGYSGYLLPSATALMMAYAIFRGYRLMAVVLNVAIAAFLLGIGESRNFWDYVIDPVAWIIGCGTWVAVATGFLLTRIVKPANVLAPSQPSSGIGETPISHRCPPKSSAA